MASLIWNKHNKGKWMEWGDRGGAGEEMDNDAFTAVLSEVEMVVGEAVEGDSLPAAGEYLMKTLCETGDVRFERGLRSLPAIVHKHDAKPTPVWVQSYAGFIDRGLEDRGTYNARWLHIVDKLIQRDTEGDLCAPLEHPKTLGMFPLYLDNVRERVMLKVYTSQEEVEMDLRYVIYYAILTKKNAAYHRKTLSWLEANLPWPSALASSHACLRLSPEKLKSCHSVITTLTSLDTSGTLSDLLPALSQKLRLNSYDTVESFVQDLQSSVDASIRDMDPSEREAAAKVACYIPSVLAEARVWS
eukprot:TRINITY_DN42452_c0_g1_i1.p1 TRINITY_DN42452_c0_g1~~TRINITY_DN42452_c0_g1_i1.p1  ORF type:complete len:314 (+),score=52.78 TRINITY_DN42452_c0_g1_i1:41-943(+)